MAILTSRTSEAGIVKIDTEKCNGCGVCATVCKDFDIKIENGKAVLSKVEIFGCMACGQCEAVCTKDAIKVSGRTLVESDFIPLPDSYQKPDYESLYKMLISRKSIRDFKEKEIDEETIRKILDFAATAPMGIPPSDVEVLVLNGKEKVKSFTDDFGKFIIKIEKIFTPFYLAMMRPFIGKDKYKLYKSFVLPLTKALATSHRNGKDHALYGAPLAIYFYGTPYADTADAYIAATYAMIGAESLGLGSCLIGCIGPFIKKGGSEIKKKYGIRLDGNEGIFVIFGYPKYKYHKAIKRSFAKVNYY